MKLISGWATYGAVLLIGLAFLSLAPASAESHETFDPSVARISLIRGVAFLLRGERVDQVAGSANVLLLRGDAVSAGVDSQVEIQLDHSNTVRLAPGSQVRIADLTDLQIQLQLARGLVTYAVLKTNQREIELDTPNMTVHLIMEGSYRIQVISPTETQMIVRKGDADVTTLEGAASVDEGSIIMVRGGDDPEYLIAKAPDLDDWDEWNGERDKQIQNSKSYEYAKRYQSGRNGDPNPMSNEYTERYQSGTEDSNRRWVYAPAYGNWCLTPYVNLGWLPGTSDYQDEWSFGWSGLSIRVTMGDVPAW